MKINVHISIYSTVTYSHTSTSTDSMLLVSESFTGWGIKLTATHCENSSQGSSRADEPSVTNLRRAYTYEYTCSFQFI